MSYTKRDAIIKDEMDVQNNPFDLNIPKNGKKFFVTFPYPYMNGVMHLGHGYTISKAEFISRFYEINGYDVLFPFGFHGTGMPIVACANRLKDELIQNIFENNVDSKNLDKTSQAYILKSMGISDDELPYFTDPYYWLKYFPTRAKQDLIKFGISADFSRSFITTDINPFYDSFIKWQFNKLYNSQKVVFGKKPIIYSPKDKQPCADHDRNVGEGVDIKTCKLIKLRILYTNNNYNNTNNNYDNDENDENALNIYLLGVLKNNPTIEDKVPVNVIINSNATYHSFITNDGIYICRSQTLRNIWYQYQLHWTSIKMSDNISGSELINQIVLIEGTQLKLPIVDCPNLNTNDYYAGTGIYITYATNISYDTVIGDTYEYITYHEPEHQVVSRSKDICVVAIIDQWFIDYYESTLKSVVTNYVNYNLVTNNENIKSIFVKASENLNQWPLSRSMGLGTKLLDTEYLIDSLSDSTIYMAYYTIAHLIDKIPLEYIDDKLWDYVFLDIDNITGAFQDTSNKHILDIINEMKNQFKYWYPVDLRVSGKDLISNHLTMTLYNHAMIWSDINMMPKRYFVNGHVLLNGMKMSKSTGNFMTIADTIEKHGCDPTRIALAIAGSDIDDANFTDNNAVNAILKLTTEKEWCTNMIDNMTTINIFDVDYTFWDTIFDTELNWCIDIVYNHYQNMDFQKVIVDGFYGILNIRDSYKSKYEKSIIQPNYVLLHKFIEYHLMMIYPIAPHYAITIWKYGESKGIVFNKSWQQVISINSLRNKVSDKKTLYEKDQFNTCIESCRSSYHNLMKRYKKNNKLCDPNNLTLHIKIFRYSPQYIDILNHIRLLLNENKDWKTIFSVITSNTDNKNKGIFGRFIKYVQSNVEKYDICWIDWITNDCSDYNIINEWLPKLVDIKVNTIIETSDVFNDKYYPWNPSISLY